MRQGVCRKYSLLVLSLLFAAVGALRAEAQVQVTITSSAPPDPDPVYIATGDAVFWIDGDGLGPYGIYASDGSWNTVTGGSAVQFNAPGTYTYTTDAGDFGTIYVTTELPPVVAITSPTNRAVIPLPAIFDFTANASDPDGLGLSDVEFYDGTNLVDDVFSPGPYTTSVTNLSAGTHTLTVIAYDNAFLTATNSISITVEPSLLITRVGKQFAISWNTNTTGFSLKSTTNLAPVTVWTPVTNTPATNGSQLVMTSSLVGPRRFFRLSNK
jgi:hypothetical protein